MSRSSLSAPLLTQTTNLCCGKRSNCKVGCPSWSESINFLNRRIQLSHLPLALLGACPLSVQPTTIIMTLRWQQIMHVYSAIILREMVIQSGLLLIASEKPLIPISPLRLMPGMDYPSSRMTETLKVCLWQTLIFTTSSDPLFLFLWINFLHSIRFYALLC